MTTTSNVETFVAETIMHTHFLDADRSRQWPLLDSLRTMHEVDCGAWQVNHTPLVAEQEVSATKYFLVASKRLIKYFGATGVWRDVFAPSPCD